MGNVDLDISQNRGPHGPAFCPGCGVKASADARYCSNCGMQLEQAEAPRNESQIPIYSSAPTRSIKRIPLISDHSDTKAPHSQTKTSPLSLAGIGSAIVGVFVLPAIFSSIGIILGVAAGKNRGAAGWGAIIVGSGGLLYFLYQIAALQNSLDSLFG